MFPRNTPREEGNREQSLGEMDRRRDLRRGSAPQTGKRQCEHFWVVWQHYAASKCPERWQDPSGAVRGGLTPPVLEHSCEDTHLPGRIWQQLLRGDFCRSEPTCSLKVSATIYDTSALCFTLKAGSDSSNHWEWFVILWGLRLGIRLSFTWNIKFLRHFAHPERKTAWLYSCMSR